MMMVVVAAIMMLIFMKLILAEVQKSKKFAEHLMLISSEAGL
jgi:hypothetical protein